MRDWPVALGVLGIACIVAWSLLGPSLGSDGSARRIYWGAWVEGVVHGVGNAPWDMRSVVAFERQAGKRVSIIHFGQPWWSQGRAQPFYPQPLDAVREHGAIPLVDWASWDLRARGSKDQPAFSLARIVDGRYDEYIRAWAKGARDWGHPFFLRFDHEMNGDWFPWSEGVNGNEHGEFVAAWRHVHDLFEAVGATNVTWVWSPVVEQSGRVPLAELYPGSSYVDWVAMDGYNFGESPVKADRWVSFDEVFGATYRSFRQLAPSKPIMIAEIGSTEHGGSKAAWISEALGMQLAISYPDIKALVWFNSLTQGDWPIATSPSARTAFAHAIASPYYADNQYRTAESPIQATPRLERRPT